MPVSPDPEAEPGLSRRTLLKIAAVELCSALPRPSIAQLAGSPSQADGRRAVAAYLERLSRPDGGYAWEDQEHSHLTPTFAVIGAYRLLGQSPRNRSKVAEYVRDHHPARLKKLEQEHREFEYQQIQGLLWLGADASSFREQVLGWKRPVPYLKQYETHTYPVFRFQLTAFTCRRLLGLPADDLASDFVPYLDARRRDNGSFNNTPATDGSDGHVLNTWWGIEALTLLGRGGERRGETIAWLRACQLPVGGFTYQPKAEVGALDDVAYTWSAVRALKALDAEPADCAACVRYLASLHNADGGFSDRPDWLSNPVATYYALDALDALGALDAIPVAPRPPSTRSRLLPVGLKVFSIQIEAHGKGSPAEAVDLARSLRLHLWGAKNARPEWLARAQAIADREGVPVKFFVANEEYGTLVDVPGLGTYSHTSDIIAPPGVDFGKSMAGQGASSWLEFRARRLAPLQAAGGRLIWQFGENEELVRIYLDDSLMRGGYAAISTFHFGNPDFTNSEPFLNRYRGQIPFVGLQDAHGDEPWWFSDQTTGFRTVFLAREPSWDGWLDALKEDRVVAIRHDAVSGFKTWVHGGRPEVIDFVRHRELDWRWWDNPEIGRPLVSIVALTPADALETDRPERGVTLRVRCAWENTPQGVPKTPIVKLVSFTLDGINVMPGMAATPKAKIPGVAAHTLAHHLPDLATGEHTATAIVRVIETGAESSRSIKFRT